VQNRPGLLFFAWCISLLFGGTGWAGERVIYVDGFAVDTLEESPTEVFEFDGLELDQPLQVGPRATRPKGASGKVNSQSPSPAVVKPNERLHKLVSEAHRQGQGKNWGAALESISKAVDLAPRRIDILRKAAVYASLAGTYALAEKYYEAVLALSPHEPIMLGGYAAVLIRSGKPDPAIQALHRADKIAPDQMIVRFNWACLEAMGKVSGRTKGWKLISVSELAQILNWMDADKAALQQSLGEEAMTRLLQRITGWSNPDLVDQGRIAAQSLSAWYARDDYESAYNALAPLIEAGGDTVGLVMEYARAAFFSGREDVSILAVKTLSAAYPDNFMVQYNYSYILMQAGQYEEASAMLEQIGDKNPSILETKFALAGAYAGAGELDRAWPILESILDQQPDELPNLLQGEKEYLEAIRRDSRFQGFEERLKSKLKHP